MSALIARLALEYATKAVEHVPPAYRTFIRERIEDALRAFQAEAARVAREHSEPLCDDSCGQNIAVKIETL